MTIYVFAILLLFVLITLAKAIKIVPQKQVKIIERLGKFHRDRRRRPQHRSFPSSIRCATRSTCASRLRKSSRSR